MKDLRRDNSEAQLDRASDESAPVGKALDQATPEMPQGGDIVSWSPKSSEIASSKADDVGNNQNGTSE